jgi:uncharacterized membrane protein
MQTSGSSEDLPPPQTPLNSIFTYLLTVDVVAYLQIEFRETRYDGRLKYQFPPVIIYGVSFCVRATAGESHIGYQVITYALLNQFEGVRKGTSSSCFTACFRCNLPASE